MNDLDRYLQDNNYEEIGEVTAGKLCYCSHKDEFYVFGDFDEYKCIERWNADWPDLMQFIKETQNLKADKDA